MASYHVCVNKALTVSQQDLIDHKEHCSADPEKLAMVGRALGHQLRIKRNDSQYALYTVSQVRQEIPDNIIRMGDNCDPCLSPCCKGRFPDAPPLPDLLEDRALA